MYHIGFTVLEAREWWKEKAEKEEEEGGLWLSGVLAYFLYNYGSMAIGAAYNSLFLIYVALFSASLFGLVLVLTSFDVQALPAHFSRELSRRGKRSVLTLNAFASQEGQSGEEVRWHARRAR